MTNLDFNPSELNGIRPLNKLEWNSYYLASATNYTGKTSGKNMVKFVFIPTDAGLVGEVNEFCTRDDTGKLTKMSLEKMGRIYAALDPDEKAMERVHASCCGNPSKKLWIICKIDKDGNINISEMKNKLSAADNNALNKAVEAGKDEDLSDLNLKM